MVDVNTDRLKIIPLDRQSLELSGVASVECGFYTLS